MQNEKNIIRIAIDLVPVVPGKGGCGGGVWTYASSLVNELDRIGDKDCQFVVFVNNSFRMKLKNIKIIRFPFFRKNPLLHLLWVHIVLPVICFKNKIHILHKISAEVPLFPITKLIVTVHDLMMKHYLENKKYASNFSFIQKIKAKYFVLIGKHAIKKSKIVLCPTESISKEITDRFNSDRRTIRFIHEGYGNDSRHHTNIRERGKSKQPELLYVAGFFPHKNHINAILTLEYLLTNFTFEKGFEPKLVFRGHKNDKTYYKKIKKYALCSKFKDNIIIKEYEQDITQEDIYKNASIVLQLSEYEGFGLPLIEAQSFGIPVICSDIAVFRETMKNSAMFVDSDHISYISKKIYSILQNKDIAADLIQKGFANIKRFSWTNAAIETTKVYKSVKEN